MTYKTPVIGMMDETILPVSSCSCEYSSIFEYHLKVDVSAESLDRLAEAKWEEFDNGELRDIKRGMTCLYTTKVAANKLPDGTKLDAAVDLSFSVNANVGARRRM